MTNDPQAPSDILDELQRELDEIDQTLDDESREPTDPPTDDELAVARLLAGQGRFSEVSGEIADDLLSDEDTLEPELRDRLTAVAERALADRRTLTGPLEGLLAHHRQQLDLTIEQMLTEIEQMLADRAPDLAAPNSEAIAKAEAFTQRIDKLGRSEEESIEILAAWIDAVELEHSQAVSALGRSLPELASAGFGSSSAKRRTLAAGFVRRLASRLGVDHP